MNHISGRFPASRSEFLELIKRTEYETILRDESTLEKTVIVAMKSSDDDITREIGEGLRSGTMTWRTIATASVYSGFYERGLASLRQFDFNGLAHHLESAQTEAVRRKQRYGGAL